MKTLKTLKFLGTALVMVCASHGASAHDAGLSPQFATCMDKSGSTTLGMIECITVETQRQDVLLNTAYKNLMAELPAARKTQLQQAQRVWISYRDANCGFYYDPDGGSMARISANNCVMSATAERARELEIFRQ